jgi:hypothetical protein
VNSKHGLFFDGPDRPLVTAEALRQALGAAGSSVRLVILNACTATSKPRRFWHTSIGVVGMTGSIPDDAARNFAIGFYGGLGANESVAAAHRQGCAAITLAGLATPTDHS